MTNHRPPLTVAEAASHFAVSKDTIRAWVRCGRLKAVRLSKRITRIPWQSVVDFEQTEAPDSTVRKSTASVPRIGTSFGAKTGDRSDVQLERLIGSSPSKG